MSGTIALGSAQINVFMQMYTPNSDGIKPTVILEKEDKEIFENGEKMLSFCQIKPI